MEPSLESLLQRLDHIPDQFRELKEGTRLAVEVADLAPKLALTQCRSVLEIMVRDVFEKRIQEPAGTRQLGDLLQRLVKDNHLPPLVNTYTNAIKDLGNIGTHKDQAIAVWDVSNSLSQLISVVEWYAQGAPGNPEPTKKPPPKPSTPEPTKQSLAIVPKGLRSFDAGDAKFFLELLPGPRDEKGLPESIRFWKHRIETAQEITFTVGVIYGPSGCGKSSLVKAGLLPKLGERVFWVYVEAAAEDTEARLLRALRKRCPNLPTDLDLTASLLALRQGKSLNKAQKVLIVLDQFEQWLHATQGQEDTELTRALRQCDGERVQTLVTVREDFWVGVSRFMGDLGTKLLDGQNACLVDLFNQDHARKVLAAFGRAFGRVQEEPASDQQSFIDQAVEGLSHDGRIICVRLALFAEMVKGKPWTPATLKEVGGTAGVGVTFLEETFSSSVAGPRNRQHQEAARAVLKALLPEQGTNIKGNMQSQSKLLQASGYAGRAKDFEELLWILDSEVRLITPTDPPGEDANTPAPEKYYQLTHDYLVHSLRDWLTRKQKETRRGRAELRLAERASLWSAKAESRHLPAWWEWANIRLLTRKHDWTSPQRKMMRKASRYHAVRGLILIVSLALLALSSWEIFGRIKAQALRDRLVNANTTDVPLIIADLAPYRRWTDPLLGEAYAQGEADQDARLQLHASLALLPVDSGQVEYLYRRLLDAEPSEVPVIRDALQSHKEKLIERLWSVVQQPPKDHEGQRLRAGCALASYDPKNPRWAQVSGPVVAQLVSINLVYLGIWLGDPRQPGQGFRPVKDKLLEALTKVFNNRNEGQATARSLATSILADYAADQPDRLADLVQDADETQFKVLFPKLEAQREQVLTTMDETLATVLESKNTEEDKERLAKRKANAGVTLFKMGQPEKVWALLQQTTDSRVRSYLIHRLGPLKADPGVVEQRLKEEKEISIRRALLLILGQFGPDQLSLADRENLIHKVVFPLYQDDLNAGVHGAAEWVLRQWGQQEKIDKFEFGWAKDLQRQEGRQEQIKHELAKDKERGDGFWYVNGQRQTMVVISGPVEFLIGSPAKEDGREGGPEGELEKQHPKRIGRSFAIAAKEVTVEQYLQFRKDHDYNKKYAPTLTCPVNDVRWYNAAAYCNWLSAQERIPQDQWCYEPNASGNYAEGMKLASDYLKRKGYRLPTEAEWEYACRAGSVTSRYYGETDDLLGQYAWYTKNSQERWMIPGGTLKPNDLGLFDMLGNALEWCQEQFAPYRSGDDTEDTQGISDGNSRVLRGGSFIYLSGFVRCADRNRFVPSDRFAYVGFRPARTFTP